MTGSEDQRRRLQGLVAVVTGASRGIGAETARLFAANGAAVAVTARTVDEGDSRFEGSISTTVEQIVATGGRAVAVAADLSEADDRRRLVSEAADALGPIDILVNNGAVTWFEPVVEMTERHWRLKFEVQVRAPFELAQLVVPGMVERGHGSVLNISSKAGLHPGLSGSPAAPGTVYGMVKAALERFSTGLAAELDGTGVTANALSPTSVVATPGVLHHRLVETGREPWVEPQSMMARAALELVSGGHSGLIAYSHQLLAELGLEEPPEQHLLVGEHPRQRPRAASSTTS
jgi:NAD(P)-dependent dehydrogenase (short-subunit alcohol dehydrogenase family)